MGDPEAREADPLLCHPGESGDRGAPVRYHDSQMRLGFEKLEKEM